MTESEPQFIIRMPDGRKSKPTTKARIREMHLNGKISDDAVVQRVGTVFEIPIPVFLRLSDPLVAAAEFSPPAASGENRSPNPVFNNVQETQLPEFAYRGRRTATNGFMLVIWAIVSWPISGFIIPSRGANPTRDCLRRTIDWIELWLRLIHLSSLAVLLLMTGTAMLILFVEVRLMQQDGTRNLWGMLLRIAFGIYAYLAIFLALVISEAFLRVVPASLRYAKTSRQTCDIAQSKY